MKNYSTYIKESTKPRMIDIEAIILKYPHNAAMAEKELTDLLVGEVCIWYTNANTIKKQIVSDVEVDQYTRVLFNGFHVNKEYNVEIEEMNEPDYIVGFPTGEVLFLKKPLIDKLKKMNLVKYYPWIRWRDKDYRFINVFMDVDYYKVQSCIDPNYSRPEPSGNIHPKSSYEEGDVVVCQGKDGSLDLDYKIGRILSVLEKDKKRMHLIEFIMRFSDLLHDGSGKSDVVGNCWWVKIENIKGLYTGNIGAHLLLKNKQKEQLEDHEIDDDYYIKQLFKK